ncbi:hypothetical protein ABVT39_015596 [Epinephelus coioides]
MQSTHSVTTREGMQTNKGFTFVFAKMGMKAVNVNNVWVCLFGCVEVQVTINVAAECKCQHKDISVRALDHQIVSNSSGAAQDGVDSVEICWASINDSGLGISVFVLLEIYLEHYILWTRPPSSCMSKGCIMLKNLGVR